jgi:hypothetical protein
MIEVKRLKMKFQTGKAMLMSSLMEHLSTALEYIWRFNSVRSDPCKTVIVSDSHISFIHVSMAKNIYREDLIKATEHC